MTPDTLTVSLILFGGLALLIFLRVPIGISLGISGVLTFLYTKGSFMAMAQTYYDSVDSFPLMAVPLFFLAGSIMEMVSVVREFGGRMASILSTYERAPSGYRNVYLRCYDLPRDRIEEMLSILKQKAKLRYIVDHRENRRTLYEKS